MSESKLTEIDQDLKEPGLNSDKKEDSMKNGRRDSGIDEESSMVEKITRLKISDTNEEDSNNNINKIEPVTNGMAHDWNSQNESTVTKEEENTESYTDEKKRIDNSGSSSDSETSESPKQSHATQSQGRMSPAEFFQATRLRSSALANKLNTSETFGGSAELFPSASDNECVQDITKAMENVALDEKTDLNNEDNDDQRKMKIEQTNETDETEDKRELIDRSPVPVYTNNRHVHHPYQQAPAKYPSQATYVRPKPGENMNYSPAYYIEQQRYKAAGHCGYVAHAEQPYYQPQMTPSANYPENANCASWSPSNYCYQQQSVQAQYPQLSGSNGSSQYQSFQGVLNAPGYVDVAPPVAPNNPITDICQLMANSSPMQALSPFDLSPMQPVDGAKLYEDTFAGEDKLATRPASKHDAEEFDIKQLPDELSDFILTYSRHYSSAKDGSVSADGSSSPECAILNDVAATLSPLSTGYETSSIQSRTPSAVDTSSVNGDIFSPSSAFYTNSPEIFSATEGHELGSPAVFEKEESQQPSCARERFRERIEQKDLDAAWAWAIRCSQTRPETLFFRDKDGDSLLHIVIWHKDLAKAYVLTEIMLKHSGNGQSSGVKLFDLPNKSSETPLYLAVEKGLKEVVDYLLECGADATVRSKHGDADTPIHYAAARGMPDMVRILCSPGRSVANILNGAGITPLVSAVKNHGNLDEESQSLLNNAAVVKVLLKAGADPTIQDTSNGKNVLHYCVERLDRDMVQLFADCLDRSVMSLLVNTGDHNERTPLATLNDIVTPVGTDKENARAKIWKILIEFSDVDQLKADDFGDLSVLLSDQFSLDEIQFTTLDNFLSSEAY